MDEIIRGMDALAILIVLIYIVVCLICWHKLKTTSRKVKSYQKKYDSIEQPLPSLNMPEFLPQEKERLPHDH